MAAYWEKLRAKKGYGGGATSSSIPAHRDAMKRASEKRVHVGSCPAGMETQTQIISRKVDKFLSHKAEGYHDVSMVNVTVYIQKNPVQKVQLTQQKT